VDVAEERNAGTLAQQTNFDGWPKPGELIEITGAHALEAGDRYALNVLFEHAHDSGRLAAPGAEWELPLARLRPSETHKGNERVRDSLRRLAAVVLTVPIYDAKRDQARTLITNLFAYLDMSRDEDSPGATVRYAVAIKLGALLEQSRRWGRIKAEVICAMRSKYAIALYELVRLRAERRDSVETFDLDRFRDLMGVPPGKLLRGADLTQYCIEPAVLEVNALSEMQVDVKLDRASPRAPIRKVLVTWRRKSGPSYRAAVELRQEPKSRRSAGRLKATA